MRALWPLGRHGNTVEADAAVEAANRSFQRAVKDRLQATAVRAEADAWKAQVRDHNAANRYDDWLRSVMRGEGG